MKYARIQKDENAWPILVGFKNNVERAEQWIRFGYEYPDGTWENMEYYTARKNGYAMRHWKDGKAKRVELCDGRSFPAILTNRTYKELDKHEQELEEHNLPSVEDYYRAMARYQYGADGNCPTGSIEDLEALKSIRAALDEMGRPWQG